jgi:hypothetical protein
VRHVSAPRRRRNHNFDLNAKRRKEIVLIARHVGAAQTDDFDRYLIAWVWHNPRAIDQIWSVMEAAKRMGGGITEAKASEITEEASITPKHLSADNLARFLGVTYAKRQALRLTTIGSIDIKKRARKELRKRRDRMAKEAKRRARGMRPQSESLSRAQPWRELGMSRTTWYRRNKTRKRRETTLSAAIFLSSEDRSVSPAGEAGLSERGFASKKECPRSGRGVAATVGASGLASSQTATTMAVDVYATLPLELRLSALCLPMPENLARRAA